MRIENEGGGGRGKKLPLEQKACAEDVGMKNAMGLGRVREYSLKKAELRRECRKLRLYITEVSERFFLFPNSEVMYLV